MSTSSSSTTRRRSNNTRRRNTSSTSAQKRNTTATQRSARGKASAPAPRANPANRTAKTARPQASPAASTATTAAGQRAKAEAFQVQELALQAQRPALVYVGAVLTTAENVAETARKYRTRTTATREVNRLQKQVSTDLKKF